MSGIDKFGSANSKILTKVLAQWSTSAAGGTVLSGLVAMFPGLTMVVRTPNL
jgi:hypothetical protein